MRRQQVPRGFTLVEMLVVVTLVSILASIALPLAELTAKRQREEELRLALREIRGALDAYKRATDEGRIARRADESGYPPSLDVLAEGVEDARSPTRARLFFLRRVPRDPFFPDAGQPATRTWALRSYESPPTAPRAGRDVFDVASTSSEIGLNGSPYNQW